MNTPIERLETALETLGLKAVEARLENLLEQASKKEPSYADFLDELLSCEVEARRTRYLRARLQLAHFPFVKTFEQFDFGFQPSLRSSHARSRARLGREAGWLGPDRAKKRWCRIHNGLYAILAVWTGWSSWPTNSSRNSMPSTGLSERKFWRWRSSWKGSDRSWAGPALTPSRAPGIRT